MDNHTHSVLSAETRLDAIPAMASLVGVTKTFGGTVAVSDVSIDLRAGEVLALLGENGAGKAPASSFWPVSIALT